MSDVTFAAIGRADFTGRNGIGSISVPGLKVGDQMFFVCRNSNGWTQPGNYFETVISVNGQIQQTSALDLSAETETILFFRAV